MMNTQMYKKFSEAQVEGWAGRPPRPDQGPRRRLSQDIMPLTIYSNASTKRKSELSKEILRGEEGSREWKRMLGVAQRSRFISDPNLLFDRGDGTMAAMAAIAGAEQVGLRQRSKINFKKARKTRRLDTTMV